MGNSIATTVNWSTNILMSMTFLTIIDLLSKQGAFLLYSCVSIIFLLIFSIYLPETKQVPLEQIRSLFSDEQWGQSLWQRRDPYSALHLDEVKTNDTLPKEATSDRDSGRYSDGTNDSGLGGGGNGSVYGGSQQSKVSYQLSYNGGILPPVELFQSDSSHSIDQAQRVTSHSSSIGGAILQVDVQSTSQQSGDDLAGVNRRSPSVVML
jgi:hypothetical protein